MPGRTRPDSQRCRQPHLPWELCSSRPTCSSTCSSRACARSTWTPRPRTRYVYIAMHPRACNDWLRQEQDGARRLTRPLPPSLDLPIGTAPAPSSPSSYRGADSDDDNSCVPSAHHRLPAQCPGSSDHGDSPEAHTHRKRYASPPGKASWCCPATADLGSNRTASITEAQITGGKGRRVTQASNPLCGKRHTTTCVVH